MNKETKIVLGIIILCVLAVVVAHYVDFSALTMANIVAWYSKNLNYATIALLMAVESSFIPFPSEVVVPPAAFFSQFAPYNQHLNIYLVVVAATVGALVGSAINYFLALVVGRPIVYRFADSKIGHACLIDVEKVHKAEDFFNRHGVASTFFGRLVPAVRQLISIPAGLVKMNKVKFFAFTALGAGLWNAVLASLGYFLSLTVSEAELMEKVEYYNHYLTMGGYVLALLIVVYIAYNVMKKRH